MVFEICPSICQKVNLHVDEFCDFLLSYRIFYRFSFISNFLAVLVTLSSSWSFSSMQNFNPINIVIVMHMNSDEAYDDSLLTVKILFSLVIVLLQHHS